MFQVLEAAATPELFGELATQYEAAMADPDLVARTTALANRFEALAGVAENDPAVDQVAAEIAALRLETFASDGTSTRRAHVHRAQPHRSARAVLDEQQTTA